MNPGAWTVSEWAAAGAIFMMFAGAVGAVARWGLHHWRARRAVRITVARQQWGPTYISSLAVHAQRDPAVTYVATWLQVNLFNNGAEPVAVERIMVHEEGQKPRPPIRPIVRSIIVRSGQVSAEGPLDYPIHLAGGQPLSVWLLCPFLIPLKVGEPMARLYAASVSTARVRAMMAVTAATLRKEVGSKVRVLGIKRFDVSMPLMQLNDGITDVTDGKVEVAPRFGTIPVAVELELMNLPDARLSASDFVHHRSRSFNIDFHLGDGRKLVHRIRTSGSVFWFLYGHTSVPICDA